jgi:hypothetical protein
MASIITDKYRTDNTSLFYSDIEENDYYIFISSLERSIVENTKLSKRDLLEKTLFGKKISVDNVFFAFQNIIWESGTIYTQYNDNVDLKNKNFYVVIYPENNDTGNYLIFKCLFNNYGAPSVTPPNFIPDNESQIYRTTDGYIWKFMFDLSTIEFDKFNMLGYIPIISESSNTAIIENSSIDIIEVENFNTNNGYINRSGSIVSVDGNGVVTLQGDLENIPDFYAGMFFYVNNTDNVAAVYEIKNYRYNSSTQQGILEVIDFVSDIILIAGSTFSITPRIEVNGDGTGCVAIPIMQADRIVRVLVLDSGEGYTNAAARVIDPFGFNPDLEGSFEERATLKPILSPAGGHGSNISEELLVNKMILYTELTDQNNNNIPITNQYSKIGLVRNPEFSSNTEIEVFDNRLQLELNSTSGLFVGETVSQLQDNKIIFEAIIHEIDANTLYLAEYMGPYPEYESTGISLNPNLNILSSQSVLFDINNTIIPDYNQRTGEIYYMVDFESVERTSESNEEYKILLEF